MEKKHVWLELPKGRAGPSRVGQSDGVWSPGISGIWVVAGETVVEAATGKTQTCSEDLGKKGKSQLVVGH